MSRICIEGIDTRTEHCGEALRDGPDKAVLSVGILLVCDIGALLVGIDHLMQNAVNMDRNSSAPLGVVQVENPTAHLCSGTGSRRRRQSADSAESGAGLARPVSRP